MDKGKSEIEDKSFFLSKNGKNSPKDEMFATIEALYHEKTFSDNSTACRFPARKRWLIEELDLKDLPEVNCKKYNKIFNRVDPVSATLIFAAAHLNSPASMFGHTFLRINSSYNSRLLSYAINYAANADPSKENTFIFSIKGLIGGYYGLYSMLPYYDKLKEYRDAENRDIWEYDLNLSKDEVIRMFEHIWEIQNTNSSYYFFTKNCSYEILWFLEIARPNVHLRDKFGFQVIPLETVHIAKEENLIRKTNYRPSKRSKIEAYAKVLNYEEIQLSKKLATSEISPKFLNENVSYSVDKKKYILETAIEFVQYYYQSSKMNKEKYLKIFHTLTVERAKLGKPHKIIPEIPPNPLKGHRAIRISTGIGAIDGDSAFYVGIRPAYHDLKDSPYGYLRGTQIEFLDLNLMYNENKLKLDKFTVLSIDSIAQYNSFFNRFSWRMNAGFDRNFYKKNSTLNLSVAFGGSVGNEYFYTYLLAEPMVYIDKYFNAGIGGAAGLVIDKYCKYTNTNLEYDYRLYDKGISQSIFDISQNFRTSQNTAIKISYSYKGKFEDNKKENEQEYKLSFSIYF